MKKVDKIDDAKFSRICDLVRQQEISEEEISELKMLEEETKAFGIVKKNALVDLPDHVQLRVTPAFYLAYEGETKALEVMLSHFPVDHYPHLMTEICEGYALAGSSSMLNDLIYTPHAHLIYAIGKFLALGQHWEKFLTIYPKREFTFKTDYIKGFVNGLCQIIQVKYPHILYHWLTKKLPKIDDIKTVADQSAVASPDPFLREVLKELSGVVSYNPLKLLDDSKTIQSHYGTSAEIAVAGWAQLYVFFWQGPKSKSFLPIEMLILIARFFCSEKLAEKLVQEIPPLMSTRLPRMILYKLAEQNTEDKPKAKNPWSTTRFMVDEFTNLLKEVPDPYTKTQSNPHPLTPK